MGGHDGPEYATIFAFESYLLIVIRFIVAAAKTECNT